MKPAGTFATPYGVSVPVFENPNDPEGYLFGMEATAICAGIHDPLQRKRFADDATAAGKCEVDRLPDYGGAPVPRKSISRPSSPAYLALPKGSEIDIPIENWITALLDVHRWCDRGEVLLDIIGGNLENRVSNGYEDRYEPILALGLQIMLTASLEHLVETEIDCLEAAAFYALSVHDEWRRPAIEWLKPMSGTWLKDWIATRPAYRQFAKLVGANTSLPAWLWGVAE